MQLRRHCRVHGQRLPDKPNTYGAASLRITLCMDSDGFVSVRIRIEELVNLVASIVTVVNVFDTLLH